MSPLDKSLFVASAVIALAGVMYMAWDLWNDKDYR